MTAEPTFHIEGTLYDFLLIVFEVQSDHEVEKANVWFLYHSKSNSLDVEI